MDIANVLSSDLTSQEEEVIKLHKEINERIQTYEKGKFNYYFSQT